jgi:hypothetical protein
MNIKMYYLILNSIFFKHLFTIKKIKKDLFSLFIEKIILNSVLLSTVVFFWGARHEKKLAILNLIRIYNESTKVFFRSKK